MSEELKPLPCPFCGGTEVTVCEGSTFRWRVLSCNDCGAQAGEIRVQTMGDGTPDEWEKQAAAEAIAEWNRRAQPAQIDALAALTAEQERLGLYEQPAAPSITGIGTDKPRDVFPTSYSPEVAAHADGFLAAKPAAPDLSDQDLTLVYMTGYSAGKADALGLARRLNEHDRKQAAAAPSVAPEPVELSPEFTDTARAALLWVLWHHMGGSSPIGQPIRVALGMGAHERLGARQIAEAKRWAALSKSSTAEFHAVQPRAPLTDAEVEALIEDAGAVWTGDYYRLDGADLFKLVRAAHGISAEGAAK